MVQGYYTLQEAAQHLNISIDELKQLAQKGKIRSFQDRGTLRFRIQDVQELARQRGISSDPDLVLGEASLPPKKGDSQRSPRSPAAAPKTPTREEAQEVFEFEFDEPTDPGHAPPSSGSKKSSGSGSKPKSGSQPKSGTQARSGPVPQAKEGPRSGVQSRSGVQKPGSDSDVKLVGAGDKVAPDSDIRLREKGGPKSPGSLSKAPQSGGKQPTTDPTKKRSSKLGPPSPQPGPDSGVRLVPMDSDSDVKIVPGADEVPLGQSPSGTMADSNVRLEKVAFPPAPEGDTTMLTDEINLDEELKKEAEKEQRQPKRTSKIKPKSQLKFPTTSPFELSDSDLDAPTSAEAPSKAPAPADSSDFDMAAMGKDDSSNFDLQVPATDSSAAFDVPGLKDDSSGNFELKPGQSSGASDDDFNLVLDDSESALAAGGGELSAPASGINLSNPSDKGISLEQRHSDDSSMEFDLSLEPESTPKPAQMKEVEGEGSSEFELSLELDDDKKASAGGGQDSDSEFELTLDDSGSEMLTSGAPQAKGGDEGTQQDIFESDFEIPALQEDAAGGEQASEDTELESSDFDLALDDSELAADEESGSQVVALDEEEVEPVAEGEEVEVTDVEEEAEFGELEGEEAEEIATGPARVEYRDKILRPAPWGAVPAVVMFPCVIVMLLVGLVGYELVQSSVGMHPPGMMTRALNDNVLQPMGISNVKFSK
jgi:excisionase family DNA binding protein